MTKKMNVKARGRHNLDAMVREKIREDILGGTLADGAHLSEIKISEQYGVSRTPVREALCALAADGLIEMFPNRGAFVKAPDASAREQLHETYVFLNGLAAQLACTKLSETDIARMERLVATMGNMPGDTFEDTRWQFTDMLRAFANSTVLSEMLMMVERRLPRPMMPVVENVQHALAIQQGYSVVVNAFKRQKPESAEKAMRDVMELNMETVPAVAAVGAA